MRRDPSADEGGADTGAGEYTGCDTRVTRYAVPTPATWQLAVWAGAVAAGIRVAAPARAAALAVVAAAVVLAWVHPTPGRRSRSSGATIGGSGRRPSWRGPPAIAVAGVSVLLAVLGAWRGEGAWAGLAPDRLGPYTGWVTVVDDPQTARSSTRVIVEVDGERFETWSRGRARQLRVREWRGGQRVLVSGVRSALDPERQVRVAWQHVVGELRIDWASDVDPGSGVARASNRVRAAIERGAARLPPADAALFRGLVVGDDRDQPRAMTERFRASGLSHLTAVSGQNVAFVLAACGPVLCRLRPWWRWAATVAIVAWFVSLTRFEPSIVRAGVMAGLSATAFVTGRERSPTRILAVAVLGLVVVDPLLVWSVGFWLSVGATAGVSSVGPWLAERLPGPSWVRLPVGVTLGAQVGVAVPILVVFGRLPLVSVPANLLAVPVAGAVMLYGLPAGLVAGWAGEVAPWTAEAAMAPARVGVRWVDTVAALGARLEPEPPLVWIGWAGLGLTVWASAWWARRGSR